MSGTSAGMHHFGVAEVGFCVWADGNEIGNTTKNTLVPRASILLVSVGDREGDALELARMH